MLTVLLTFTTAFALLAWIDLHKAMWLLVAILPSYLLRADILGIPTTLLELCIIALIVVWVLKQKTCPIQKTGRFLLITIGLLLISATISIITNPDTLSALGVWKAYYIEPIALFFIYKHEISNNKFEANRIFSALGLSALFLSIIAIIQWFTRSGIPIPWDIERRATSVFDYPNALGLFLGPIIIIATAKLGRIIHQPIRRDHVFWFAVVILSMLAIILAKSEAAIVSVIAVTLLMGLYHKRSRIITIATTLIVMSLLSISPWQGTIFEKLTLQDYSGTVRLSQWTETVSMLKDHWLFGAGLSGYPTVFAPYHQASHIEIFQYPHNIFLNIWVELGLLGLVILSLLVGYIISCAKTLLKHNKSTIAFFVIIQMAIHGLVDVPFFKNDLAVLTWLLLAIIFAYVRLTPTTTQKNTTHK